LIELQSSLSDAWVVLGDFNLIRSPDDRSNGNFNHQEAGWFNDAIEAMDLQELPLLDRRFTWSNRQEDPVLVRLDRFFVNTEWSLCLPNSTISSFSAAVSDHCQLLLSATTTIPKPTVFCFNNYWSRIAGFSDVVASAWLSVPGLQAPHCNQAALLVKKLKRCRHDLKAWHRSLRSPSDLLLNCNLVIAMMDKLEEVQPLFRAKFNLRKLVRPAAQEQSK